jgi:hypothetical protein
MSSLPLTRPAARATLSLRARDLIVELVFLPPDITNLTSPPTGKPVTDVRYGVVGSAAHAFRLWSNFEVLDNGFRHRGGSLSYG